MGMLSSNIRGMLNIIDQAAPSTIDIYQLESSNIGVDLKPAFYDRFMYMANKKGSDLVTLNYVIGSSSTSLPNILGSFSIGHTSQGIYVKGRYLWDMTSTGDMYQWDLDRELSVGTVTLPASSYRGLTYDGRVFWTIDVTSGNLVSFNENGGITGAITAPSDSYDLDYSNRFLYVISGITGSTGVMSTFDAASGSQVGSLTTMGTFGVAERVSGISVIEGRFIYLTWIKNALA